MYNFENVLIHGYVFAVSIFIGVFLFPALSCFFHNSKEASDSDIYIGIFCLSSCFASAIFGYIFAFSQTEYTLITSQYSLPIFIVIGTIFGLMIVDRSGIHEESLSNLSKKTLSYMKHHLIGVHGGYLTFLMILSLLFIGGVYSNIIENLFRY